MLRPVLIFKDEIKDIPPRDGWFHTWAGTNERAYALIEIDDGNIEKVKDHEFMFTEEPPDIE